MTCPTVERLTEPCFLVIARDVEDADKAAELRTAHLDGHLAHVEAHWERYLNTGPIRQPGATRLVGSTFLIFAKDEADARSVVADDPYFTSGLYGSVEVFAQTLSIGRYLGGKIWESADAIRGKAAGG
jgi:uncharacterized protein YciI